MILVTGGAGFIGGNFILEWLAENGEAVVNLDKLTYAGNPDTLSTLTGDPRYVFVRGDIGDRTLVSALLSKHRPRAVINFAAESHVDRSIHGPREFIQTNVVGACNLLEAVRGYVDTLSPEGRAGFRFLHVSTDEVFGSLKESDPPFSESTPYRPSSPYSASKAASDHLMRAWHVTYGLPILTINCSNNYGPYQYPEKLIPLCILNALASKVLPVYGDGLQRRDWLYVRDHCRAVAAVLAQGIPGETYNVGGSSEKTNLEVVHGVCDILDRLRPREDGVSYAAQITFVVDRPGHDRRYAIDAARIRREIGWRPKETFESGLLKTVEWYLANEEWTKKATSGAYRNWVQMHYGT
ncbi:dTDP-glucose 4,6-dehydratase [Noviherbaspirillum sp. ST9]|uniref:dTDP-glucose 4,6-dehydratase n=1 Tax=Noviherbaspirillum sp. ST9 TaxID=3401606 RepID=UPI003B58A678